MLVYKITNKPQSKPTAAKPSFIQCATNDANCLQEAFYQELVVRSGTKAAFQELRVAYASDPSVRSQCHPLTHVIGRTSAEKFQTVSAAYAEGDEFCWSGYYHGVMEAMLIRLGDDAVSKLNDICADIRRDKPFSFDHYNCVHGLGHGVMLINGHELFKSLENCDQLSDNWERQSCYGGVYMENIMASINPDHTTKYVLADQPLYPCTDVAEKYKQQCYSMQTSHALTVLKGDFKQVFTLCGSIEPSYKATCYQSLGRDASGQSVSDQTKTRETCMLGSNFEAQSNCVSGAVKDFISYHHSDTQANALCESLEPALSTICYSDAKSYYQTFW